MIRLAVFAPSYSDEIFLQCFYGLKSAQRELAAENESLELCYFDNNNLPSDVNYLSDDVRVLHIAKSSHFDGVMTLGGVLSYIDTGNTLAPFLRESFPGKPVINIMSRLEGVPSVFLDNTLAMHMIVDHLAVKHRYKRIGLIKGLDGHPDTEIRCRAFLDRISYHGLSVPGEWILSGDYMSVSGRKAGEVWLKAYTEGVELPEALVVSSDAMAYGFISAINEWNIHHSDPVPIPGICGFDNREFSMAITPSITSVTHPIYIFAKKAVQLLIAYIREGKDIPMEIHVPPELILRQSCGCTGSYDSELSMEFDTLKKEFVGRTVSLLDEQRDLKNAASVHAELSPVITEAIYTVGLENMNAMVDWGIKRIEESYDTPSDDIRSHRSKIFEDLKLLISQRSREYNLLLRQRSNHIHAFQEVLNRAETIKEIIDILSTSFRNFNLNQAVVIIDRALYPDCPSKNLTAMWINGDISFFPADDRIDISVFKEFMNNDWIICGLQTGDEGYGYIVCDVEPRNITEVRALARSIGRKLIEFRNLRRLLETERYAGLGKLLQGFAHYIGTPLGNSITAVSVIENQLAAGIETKGAPVINDPQLLYEAAKMALKNIDMIRDMVEIFKRLSVVSEYHTWDNGVPENLLQAGLKTEMILAGQHSVTVHVTYRTGREPVRFPTDSIRFVLHELIDNTLKFAYPDDFNNDRNVYIVLEKKDDDIIISYSDNGKGLDPQAQKNLFIPFSRMGKHSEGMGMGLFAVKRIIHNLLGGTAEVVTRKNRGFRIILTIPLEQNRNETADETGL